MEIDLGTLIKARVVTERQGNHRPWKVRLIVELETDLRDAKALLDALKAGANVEVEGHPVLIKPPLDRAQALMENL